MSVATESMLIASTEVEILAASKSPTVNIVAYTGGLMTVPGWGPVAIDLTGIDAGGDQVSILADHNASINGIVGQGRAIVNAGRLLVQGNINPSTQASRQIIELAQGGFRFQASVGVSPIEYQRIRSGDSVEINGRTIKSPSSGFTLVRASVLKEVSIVVIGADAGTSVAIAASNQKDQPVMSEIETTVETMRAESAAESERIYAIRQACAGRHGDIEARAIRDGWNIQRAELEVLRAGRPPAPLIQSIVSVPTETIIEAAILSHMGHETLVEKHLGAQAAQQARDLRVTSLVDLCRAALQVDGKVAPSGREAMIRAALSTLSLPVALGIAANKVLLDAYTESPASWRSSFSICKPARLSSKRHLRTAMKPPFVDSR